MMRIVELVRWNLMLRNLKIHKYNFSFRLSCREKIAIWKRVVERWYYSEFLKKKTLIHFIHHVQQRNILPNVLVLNLTKSNTFLTSYFRSGKKEKWKTEKRVRKNEKSRKGGSIYIKVQSWLCSEISWKRPGFPYSPLARAVLAYGPIEP